MQIKNRKGDLLINVQLLLIKENFQSVATGIYSNTGHCYHCPVQMSNFARASFNSRGNCFEMRLLNQQFQIKYDFAESATALQSKIRLRFNIWFKSRISHLPNIMHFNALYYNWNYRNPYPYWVTIFSRDWEYIQQTDSNSAPLYPTSESTAVFNHYLRLK